METMSKGACVNLKLIIIEGVDTFKMIQIDFNVLLVEGQNIFSAKKEMTIEDFVRVFWRVEDAAYFKTFIPFNRMQLLSRLRNEKEDSKMEGDFARAFQLDTLFYMLEDNRERVLSDFHILSKKVLFIRNLCKFFF